MAFFGDKDSGHSATMSLDELVERGSPIEAMEEHQPLDIRSLLEGDNRFALQVKGTSMIEDGIFDGDLIICRQSSVAHEGDIVVALIDQLNVTLKRISYKVVYNLSITEIILLISDIRNSFIYSNIKNCILLKAIKATIIS